MIKEAIDRILELKPEIKDVAGIKFCLGKDGARMLEMPRIETKKFFSITQFMNFLKEFEALDAEGEHVLVNPISHCRVEAFIRQYTDHGQYHLIAFTDFSEVLVKFKDGEELDQKDFMIVLQALFFPNAEREELLKLVGKIHSGRMTEGTDDGISQVVNMKAGVHLSSQAVVKNPWALKPFKSFPEIDPVEVP